MYTSQNGVVQHWVFDVPSAALRLATECQQESVAGTTGVSPQGLLGRQWGDGRDQAKIYNIGGDGIIV